MLVMEVLVIVLLVDGDSGDYNADDGGSGDCSAVMEVVTMSL